MNEKPAIPIKTFARYEPETVYIGAGEYIAECVRVDDGDYYLAADVDAAIEALRAEVVSERNLKADAIHACALANMRAERLAEALAELITWFPSAQTYRRMGFDPTAPMLVLKEAKDALWEWRTER